jgi:phage terminase large subunit-like protein
MFEQTTLTRLPSQSRSAGRATDKKIVARRLGELCAKYQPKVVAYDRWGMIELESRLSEQGISIPLQAWGAGFAAMSPATKSTEECILNDTVENPAKEADVSSDLLT